MPTPPAPSQAATLCYKSVQDHLKDDRLNSSNPDSKKIVDTLHLQKMLPSEKFRLPETMAQDVGWLVSGYTRPRGGGAGLGARCRPHVGL